MNTIEGRLFAVDPSLSATGWVLISLKSGVPLEAGIIKPPPPPLALSLRLKHLQLEVENIFGRLKLGQGDFLVCEGPAPLVVNPDSSLKVERVRGMFEVIARSLNISVPGRLNPRTVQHEILELRGAQLERREVKKKAREIASKIYGTQLEQAFGISKRLDDNVVQSKKCMLPQDVIDAALVGVVAVSRIRMSLLSGVNLYDLFSRSSDASGRNGGRRSASWRKVNPELLNIREK